MRTIVLALIVLTAAFSHAQTATCADGATSYSRHHSGTCSHHGGVTQWLGAGSTSANVGCGTYVNKDGLTTARPCQEGPTTSVPMPSYRDLCTPLGVNDPSAAVRELAQNLYAKCVQRADYEQQRIWGTSPASVPASWVTPTEEQKTACEGVWRNLTVGITVVEAEGIMQACYSRYASPKPSEPTPVHFNTPKKHQTVDILCDSDGLKTGWWSLNGNGEVTVSERGFAQGGNRTQDAAIGTFGNLAYAEKFIKSYGWACNK